jgi:Carboxypeptidase regulatory-like domain/TonB dependent receptor
MNTSYSRMFLTCIMIAVWSISALAQVGIEGAILGVVRDPSGAIVPRAAVTATNLDTGLVKTAVTGISSGEFEIPALPRGPYSVTVSLRGFKTWTLSRTDLDVGEQKRLSPVLQVGETAETVNVQDEAPLIQTEQSSVETTISANTATQLPLDQRNIVSLVALTPGMTVNGLDQGRHMENTVQGNGMRWDDAAFQVDGLNSNEMIHKSGVDLPTPDSLAELKVDTSNFSAEQGFGPIQVIAVTKSGTNSFHGGLWEFFQNDKLDARNTFAPGPLAKPEDRFNQFGGDIGGPIIKNKLQFFVGYEATRIRTAQIYDTLVASPQMQKGDFSQLSQPIIDPTTGQPFPGNIIPTNRISPASQSFLSYFPTPNYPGDFLRTTEAVPLNNGLYTFRVDEQLTSKQRLYGHLLWRRWDQNHPQSLPLTVVSSHGRQENFGLNYDWTINPKMLLTLSAGELLDRVHLSSTVAGPQFKQNLMEAAGFQGFPTSDMPGALGLPNLSITGYPPIEGGASCAPQYQRSQVENYKAGLNLIRGSHTINFGYQLLMQHFYSADSGQCTRGCWDFNGQYTGNGFADYLLGFPAGSTLSLPDATFGIQRWPYSALYIQDYWKLTPKVTLDLGLRYDYWHAPLFVKGEVGTFDPQLGLVIAGENNGHIDLTGQPISAAYYQATKNLIIPASQAHLPPDLFSGSGTVEPRVGIAWRPLASNGLVIRGAYGQFANRLNGGYQSDGFITPPFFAYSSQSWSTSQLQPWTTAWGAGPGGGSFGLPGVIGELPPAPNYRYHQWNVSVQKSLPSDSALTVSYVGNLVNDAQDLHNYNVPPPGNYPDLQAAMRYPDFSFLILWDNKGFSRYDGLQAQYERKFKRGLSYLVSYAFGKSLENGSAITDGYPTPFAPSHYDYGRSSYDRTHILRVSGIWELPFGRGKQFLTTVNSVTDAILGGWQFSGIYSFESGTPFTILVPGSTLGNGYDARANIVPGVSPSVPHPSANLWFNPNAFTAPPLYTLGNSGYDIMDGPAIHTLDTSLSKYFHITEQKTIQFRWEMFNALNNVNLSNPTATLDNGYLTGAYIGLPTSGQIFSTSTPSRIMQFALKFAF